MSAFEAENVGMTADLVESQIGFMFGRSGDLHQVAGAIHTAVADAHGVGDALADLAMTGATLGSYAGEKFYAVTEAGDIAAEIALAAEDLSRLAAELRAHVEGQRAASSAGEGYADPGMSKAEAQRIYDRALKDGSALSKMSPAEVAAWWRNLSSDQQQAFIEKQHWVAGNTNGIPFGDRMEANQRNAEDYLRQHPELGPGDEQYDYLTRVTARFEDTAPRDGINDAYPDGKMPVRLISFDPGHDRIIEVVGDLNENTTNIVNYIPGTSATMGGFYDGSTQALASNLVEGHPERVAFVWKDAEFPPDLVSRDSGWVGNNSWAARVGTSYTDFNLALGMESPRDIPVMSIEHSFGSSVGGYAEQAGIHFESRVSLGGAGMIEGWEPDPDTAYISLTGDVDPIRAIRGQFIDGYDLGYATPPDAAHGWREVDPGVYWANPYSQHADLPDPTKSSNVVPTIEKQLEEDAEDAANRARRPDGASR